MAKKKAEFYADFKFVEVVQKVSYKDAITSKEGVKNQKSVKFACKFAFTFY
jgi:hypothetical protein